MITEHDNFVGNRAIDDADDVPQRSCDVFLLVDQVELEVIRRRSDIVVYAFVAKSSALPIFVERGSIGAVSVQGLEQR